MNRRRASPAGEVELLAPRELVFGGDESPDFAGVDPDEMPGPDGKEPRSRWLAATAGVAVVACIVIGIVAAAPWSGSDETSAPASTSSPPTTRPPPAVSTDQPASDPIAADRPGYVLDAVPDGLALSGVANIVHGDSTAPVGWGPAGWGPAGWGEVWARPGSTRTSGAWFSLSLRNGLGLDAQRLGQRVRLLGRTGLLTTGPDGVLSLSARVPGSETRTLTVTAFGFTPQLLVSLYQFVGIDDDRPQLVDDRFVINDPSAARGFDRIATGQTRQGLLDDVLWGGIDTSTSYRTTDGTGEIDIVTAPRDGRRASLWNLAVEAVAVKAVPGLPAGLLLGTVAWPGTARPAVLASWDEGDTTVTVYSTLDAGAVLGILPSVRAASAAEWNGVKAAVAQTTARSEVDGTDIAIGGRVDLGSGSLGSGQLWTLSLDPPSLVTLDIGGSSASFGLDPSTQLDAWSTEEWTVAVALVDPSSAATAMRVRTPDGVIAETALTDLATVTPAGSFTGRAAAYAFDQMGPYVIELVDSGGSVVDQLAVPGTDS